MLGSNGSANEPVNALVEPALAAGTYAPRSVPEPNYKGIRRLVGFIRFSAVLAFCLGALVSLVMFMRGTSFAIQLGGMLGGAMLALVGYALLQGMAGGLKVLMDIEMNSRRNADEMMALIDGDTAG
jgi:hypothetical protein